VRPDNGQRFPYRIGEELPTTQNFSLFLDPNEIPERRDHLQLVLEIERSAWAR